MLLKATLARSSHEINREHEQAPENLPLAPALMILHAWLDLLTKNYSAPEPLKEIFTIS